jgi:hypothetical protein
MIALAATLPEKSHDGYVAAAYIVFFALVLIYVAIMAWRLTRVERSVRTLKGTSELKGAGEPPAGQPGEDPREQDDAVASRERETV